MKRLVAVAVALAATTAMIPLPLLAGDDRQAAQNEESAAAARDAQQANMLGEAVTAANYWLEQTRQYKRIPAMSVALVNNQKTVWSKGFGYTDRAMKQPATADTIYSICSISKLFTAVAVMQQWEQGRLRLDEPITTYLPWASGDGMACAVLIGTTFPSLCILAS